MLEIGLSELCTLKGSHCDFNSAINHKILSIVDMLKANYAAILLLLLPEKMQHHIQMPTLVRVLVHITWKVSTAMDMRLPYWTVVVSTLLVG